MIPFILAGLAIAAAGVGVKKGVDGISKIKEAEKIVERAKKRYNRQKSLVETQVNTLNTKLSKLGELYLDIYTKDLKEFLAFLERLKSYGQVQTFPKELKHFMDRLPSLKNQVNTAEKLVEGIVSGALAGGGAAAFSYVAAIGLALEIGTASTGTALSALSGAALENALLAWFGGGAISAGGFGMAVGTAVLGTIVAGPAILAGGLILDAKGDEALNKAVKFENKVEKEISRLVVIEKNVKELNAKAEEEKRVLKELRKRFQYRFDMAKEYYNYGYKSENIRYAREAAALMKAMTKLTSIPWLDKNGLDKFLPEKRKLDTLERIKREFAITV
jgi:hypothetical protein